MYSCKQSALKSSKGFYESLANNSALSWLKSNYRSKTMANPLHEYQIVDRSVRTFRRDLWKVTMLAMLPVAAFEGFLVYRLAVYSHSVIRGNPDPLGIFRLVLIGVLGIAAPRFFKSFWQDQNNLIETWIESHWTTAAFESGVSALVRIVAHSGSFEATVDVLQANGLERSYDRIPTHVIERARSYLIDGAKDILKWEEHPEAHLRVQGSKDHLKSDFEVLRSFGILGECAELRVFFSQAKEVLEAEKATAANR